MVATVLQKMKNCIEIMMQCNYNIEVINECPRPCKKSIYKTQKLYYPGTPTNANEIKISFEFGVMDVEIHDEVWILETYNFIGSVGGSLGLFIGFSYTGFLGQIVDYLFFKNN